MNEDKLVKDYLASLEARKLVDTSIKSYKRALEYFNDFKRNKHWRDIELSDILNFQQKLCKKEWSIAYRHRNVWIIKDFFTYLHKIGLILINPTEKLPPLRKPHTLPRGVISNKEVIKLLRAPSIRTKAGLRDRAIFEVLYSCGLRGLELCRLNLFDLETKERTLRIVQAKGRKDRIVPIGRVALKWALKYIREVRTKVIKQNQHSNPRNKLFLTVRGNNLDTSTLSDIFARYRKKTGLPKIATTHSLRHACATEMLRRGASIRHVQELLGHSDINTTQIYTHIKTSE